MNEHIELLIPVKTKMINNVIKIALWAIVVLAFLASFLGLVFISVIVAVIAGASAYIIGMRSDLEYEYILTAKEIDIDAIYSKQSRKNITTLDLTKLEIMAPLDSYRLDGYKNRKVKTEDFSSGVADNKKNMYVMYYDGSRKIIIEPDENLYKAIYNVAPHKVYNS